MKKVSSILRFIAIVALVAGIIILINHYGVAQLRERVEQLGAWAFLGIFLLRFSSVVIPALPGTAYSFLAGGLLGFSQGLAVICIADLCSCSLSFFLSRRFGRSLVRKLVGERFMDKVDRLSKRHLERNFFLLTGFLMTGFFDFVCYGVGLTKAPWRRFAPALIISIAISNPPIVALGAGILEGGKILLVGAMLGVFGLAIVTGLVTRNQERAGG
ncbi:MAG: VTT domain-containing protein [Cyanobacteria bacterium P01_F01_bin.150]